MYTKQNIDSIYMNIETKSIFNYISKLHKYLTFKLICGWAETKTVLRLWSSLASAELYTIHNILMRKKRERANWNTILRKHNINLKNVFFLNQQFQLAALWQHLCWTNGMAVLSSDSSKYQGLNLAFLRWQKIEKNNNNNNNK